MNEAKIILQIKNKFWISFGILIIGIVLSFWTYFSTSFTSKPIGVITDSQIKDELINKTEDNYQNKDQIRNQVLHVKVLSGKHSNHTYRIDNNYSPSQAMTQKYYPHERVILSFVGQRAKLMSPKRDWIVVLGITLVLCLLVAITGRHAIMLTLSMVLNAIIFYFVIKLDIAENGTKIFLIYGSAVIIFTLLSLLIVQGFHQKMWVTLIATLLGVFVSFGICYAIMRLTGESGIKYEAVDYATQDPRALFLAQTLLGVLGAVMDEATDIVSSLYVLCQHKNDLTFKTLFNSGRTLGQEIMGPLINVLVLIFMAEALPMTILYLRDNNTLVYTFQFALSLGVIQSLISAIGIVLTVIFATLASSIFLKHPISVKEAK